MRDHRPELAHTLFKNNALNKFQHHVDELLVLNKELKKVLPQQLAPFCQAANLKQGQLMIHVASASHQMKLNYERMNILSSLRQAGFNHLIGIEFKIAPNLYQSPELTKELEARSKPKVKKQKISPQAAESILSIADFAPPKLKLRLESLARLSNTNRSK